MMVFNPVSTCTKNTICLIGSFQKQLNYRIGYAFLQPPHSSCCYYTISSRSNLSHSTLRSFSSVTEFQAFRSNCLGSGGAKHETSCLSLTSKSIVSPRCFRRTCFNISAGPNTTSLRFLMPEYTKTSKIKFNMGPFHWKQRNVYTGLFLGLLFCSCASEPSYAEAREENGKKEGDHDDASAHYSHGKEVLFDYSVIGIPGDGRCMFRSVVHGACLRSGKPAPSEELQRKMADDLRARVADEFVKRREETEWFIEGDFETYVSHIRKPHVWGGEPELLMASHVLQMPITVYMHDQCSHGLISIAEYGQEYGKDNPIKVLYHGFGHYDALHVPSKGGRSRL